MSPSPAGPQEPLLDFAAISTHASALKSPHQLVLRYSDAILAYVSRLLPNREDAEDVQLVIVQRMLEGRFAATPVAKGRFRFYVQRAVHNEVVNFLRRRERQRGLLHRLWNAVVPRKYRSGQAVDGPAYPPAEAPFEEDELRIWRESVLSRAIDGALKELEDYERDRQERTHPNVFHTLARLLIDNTGVSSEELARRLGERVGREYQAGCTRNIVMRMRYKLAELLVAEVIRQLDDPGFDNVLDELRDLGLLAYVEPYIPPQEAFA
jgi:DNA-directed RNA polymerase specialized sigma24 family protein